jgi:catechol 2,3-dioxygenase-like lactoylglutathione lyase family enzyme
LTNFLPTEETFVRGVSNLWSAVNHVAIVVSDVGRSLAFYTDVVGMKQVIRPNFDRYGFRIEMYSLIYVVALKSQDLWLTLHVCVNFRHGAWLTMGNVDLHLIKGRPAVHADDDLVSSVLLARVRTTCGLKSFRNFLF